MDLARVLAQEAPLKWLVGRVIGLTGDTFTMAYGGGEVPGVGHVDQYTPKYGDVVHVLSWETAGMIAIGSQNVSPTPRPPLGVSAPPVIVTPTQQASYAATTGAWTPGVVIQSTDSTGVWFYASGAFAGFNAPTLGQVEIEVVAVSGGPPEFCEVVNPLPAGVLSLVDDMGSRYARGTPLVGTPTWMSLPLDWGLDLISGAAGGIGIGGGLYDGTYSGTGRVRLTPR